MQLIYKYVIESDKVGLCSIKHIHDEALNKINKIMEVHDRRKSKRISKEKINLIVRGVLPATTDLQKYHLESVKKHPDVLAIGHVIHDHREEQVLYNKKFKKLIDRCQKNSWNSKVQTFTCFYYFHL